MIMDKTIDLRTLFENFLEKFECYESQICCSTNAFKHQLMAPALQMMKEMENSK